MIAKAESKIEYDHRNDYDNDWEFYLDLHFVYEFLELEK